MKVDLAGERFESETRKLHGIGPEGICGNDTGSGLKVCAVNPHNQMRLRQAEFLVAVSRRDSPLGEESTHGAIAAEHVFFQGIKKLTHAC